MGEWGNSSPKSPRDAPPQPEVPFDTGEIIAGRDDLDFVAGGAISLSPTNSSLLTCLLFDFDETNVSLEERSQGRNIFPMSVILNKKTIAL